MPHGTQSPPQNPDASPQFVNLNATNLEEQHICCALGDPKHVEGVAKKKAWLRQRFAEGLVFRKLDVRGKVFIEYAPAEVAWRPVVAPGWLVVHCLWVSGRFSGKGYAKQLVEYALEDARTSGKFGVVIAAAKRKRAFLADPGFLRHLGFESCDQRGDFVLFARRVSTGGSEPRFAPSVQVAVDPPRGPFVARCTAQCPFNNYWAHELSSTIRAEGYDSTVDEITSLRRAQKVASPLGTFGLEQPDGLVMHHLGTPAAVRRRLT